MNDNRLAPSKTTIVLYLIFIWPFGVYSLLRYLPEWLRKIWLVVLIAIYALIWSIGLVSVTTNSDQKTANQVITTKTAVVIETVAFSEERIIDPTLSDGEEIVEHEGEDGEKTVTYKIKVVDGKSVSKVKVSEKIIKVPSNKIIKLGGQQ